MAGTLSGSRGESPGRRRRRRRGGLWREIAGRLGFVGRTWRRLESLSYSPLLTALPLGIYMFVGSAYFLAMIQVLTDVDSYTMYWDPAAVENAGEKLSAELLRQKLQAASYLLTLFLLAFRARECLAFLRSEKTLILLMLVLSLSALGSDYPERVVVNLVHLAMGLLATWVYLADERRRRDIVRSACLITLVPIMLVLGGSVVLFVVHPDGSLSAILGGQRLSGLSGNPNSLGGVCIVGAWATFGLMALTPPRSRRMGYLLVAFAVVMFNAWTTGSATTLSIIAGMALMSIGFRLYAGMSRKARAALILGLAMAFFGVLLTLAVQQNVEDYALAATEAVGKDLTLTGRTDLWAIGWQAFLERPLFGWGYDNHQTVLESSLYGIPYNHYHNGYVDTLITGGVLLGACIVLRYVMFFRRYLAVSRVVDTAFPFVVAVAAVSVQNMTEYSLFRNNTAIWHIYSIVFMAVSVIAVGVPERTRPARSVAAGSAERRRSGSRHLSW